MLRRALLLLGLAVALWIGDELAERPPRWLGEDPLLRPFGWTDPDAESGEPLEPERDNGGGPSLVTPDRPLAVNQASAEELTALPRVGPVLAGRIVALRDSLGGFASLEQLGEVRGIGPATLERLRPLVRLP